MTIIRILVGLITAILKVIAAVIVETLGLLVSSLTVVLVVVGVAVAILSGVGALHTFRRKKPSDHIPKP